MTDPVLDEFRYHVRREVAIPLEWAKLLKETAAHHYDHKCRAAGVGGVVNGLFNHATWNENKIARDRIGFSPVSWGDCDLMLKILEQVDHDQETVAAAVRVFLRRTMMEISDRLTLCEAIK